MMFKKLLVVALSAIGLAGCGDEIVVPASYVDNVASYEVADHSVYDKNGLMAVDVKAYIDGNLSAEQRAATAIEVARRWQDVTKGRLVFATLYDQELENAGFISRANLYVSKCGVDEKTCDGVQWEVSYADNSASEIDKQVFKLWYANRSNFQENGSTNDEALKSAIAERLSITPAEVSLFSYETWEHDEKY